MPDDFSNRPLAPLVYWFPGVDAIPAQQAHRFGPASGIWGRLTGLFRGDGYMMRKGQPGPVPGKYGLMVGVGELPPPADTEALRYAPDQQDWCEIETGVWCGLSKTATPTDFRRKVVSMPLSYYLNTPRGEWFIPVATLTSELCGLRMVDKFEKGKWARVPSPEHAEIAEIAEKMYRIETGEDTEKPGTDWIRESAIKALQINYALTGPELAMFGVLNDDCYDAISAILTDRAARQKKTTESVG